MPEMTSIMVAGLAMWSVEWAKRRGVDKFYVPIIAFATAGLFALGWSMVFDPAMPWRTALKDGLTLGAVTGGLYGFGKTIIGKSSSKGGV